MTNELEQQLDAIIEAAAAAVSKAIRENIAEEVRRASGGRAPSPVRGRATIARTKATTTRRASTLTVRRSPGQIAAHLKRILDYVKTHTGVRAGIIHSRVGLPKQDVASGLKRLRAEKKIVMKGARRSATYSVA